MKRQFFLAAKSFTSLLLATFLPLILNSPPISCLINESYAECGALFNCGRFTGIGFPFWGGDRAEECGYSALKLDCQNGTTTTIQINKVAYRVLELNLNAQILKIARNDLTPSLCPQHLANTTLDSGLFEFASPYVNLTLLYGCPSVGLPVPFQLDCAVDGIPEKIGYVVLGSQFTGACYSSVVVPVSDTAPFFNLEGLAEVIGEGFLVRFKVESGGCIECERSGGRCGYDEAGEKFVCFCSNKSVVENNTCPPGAAADRAPPVAVSKTASSGTHAPLPAICLSKFLTRSFVL